MKKIFLFTVFSFICFLFLTPIMAHGKNLSDQVMGQINAGASTAEFSGAGNPVKPQEVVVGVIKVLLSTVGIVFIVLMVYGGYEYVTSRGDEEQTKKALSIIRPAIIGLIIILIAYSVTLFVGNRLKEAVTEGVSLELR